MGNLVSIIIPTHGNKDLTELLNSIKNSTYQNFEIIVVNENMERSSQRNTGILRAKGTWLLFLDNDQHISEHLLLECVYSMKLVDALYIPEQIMTKGWFGRLRNWERQFYNQTPVDCVRFVRRENCPLFDTNLNGPEDADFDRRIKGKKGVTHAKIYHYDNIGILDFFRKKAYYSKSMSLFAKKHPNDKVFNFWWRCFGVFGEHSKWRRAIRNPIAMLLVWLLIFIRGVIYLCLK